MSQISVPQLGHNGKAIMAAMNQSKPPIEAVNKQVFIANSAPTTGQSQLGSLYTRAATPLNVAGPDSSAGSMVNTVA